MRRNLGIITTIILVLTVLIGLSAAGNLELDRPKESELEPIRSSYNTGPTGTRAFYQLLDETGQSIARWREPYKKLASQAPHATLIIIGPFRPERDIDEQDAVALQRWIANGGNALVISRYPAAQIGDPMAQAKITAQNPPWTASPELLVDPQSDQLIIQPTDLTRNLQGLAISALAARIKFQLPELEELEREETQEVTAAPEPTEPASDSTEVELEPSLYAPIVHLGDQDGAVLAEFEYGKGRLIFLSDPFVVANNGIARGSNLTLALNLVRKLNPEKGRIYFDEFHHGYRSENNPLFDYVRGTPVPWLFLQGSLLGLLLMYSFGKRFARPLPLPRVDRHSPLEFVGSMANLQQAAEARGLALENIYPRFKATLCRRLGLSSRASTEEIIVGIQRRSIPIPEIELRQTLNEIEKALRGEKIDDAQLTTLVAKIRRITAHFR